MSHKSWIEETFSKRDCVKFIPSSRDLHRCIPVCQVCQSLIRCCCGRLMAEHSWQKAPPPTVIFPDPEHNLPEDWSLELHTRASPTNAYGTIDFQDSATRGCRAKFVRVSVDSKPEALLQLMLREWQMDRPKLLFSVHGGSENFTLTPKVKQAFTKGLITAARSTGAWILTDGINTGVSKYVGEAVKTFGGHNLRKRNTVGVTPWGVIDNNTDLIGRDVFRPYQPLGNPLSKRADLNSFHSHFLLVDDGTLGKYGCQEGVRKKLEKHIQLLKIHPRFNQRVPMVCVIVEGGPAIVSTVLDYVSNNPPVPVFVFEGSGRAADLFAFLHKHTDSDRQLDADIKEGFLLRIGEVFGVDRKEASRLCALLLECMDHRQSITIFDSESEDHMAPDAAILNTILKGTKASAAEQLSMTLAWDRADIAQKSVLVYGQHWPVGSLEQAMLDALVMDRVSFVKLLIDNGMTMSHFLTVDRLEELYNMPQGQTDHFLHHLVEDVKQTSLPPGYRLSLIDMGLVIEYLIGGAYRSTYTRKHFRTAYNRLQDKEGRRVSTSSMSEQKIGIIPNSQRRGSPQEPHFFRTAQPYKRKDQNVPRTTSVKAVWSTELCEAPLVFSFNFNDVFVWAVLQQRQQMALFLWQHGEEALARATVACKLYRSMAFKARQSSMDDHIAEQFKAYSLEFGQLAVNVLDCAFRQNEKMAMKLLTSEMEAWSHFTSLQIAVSSCHRPFVSHSCTQSLLTDLWTGPLNMRKNSYLKIILSLLLPPAILLLEFKSKAEMCHVPQSHEAILFGRDTLKPGARHDETDDMANQDAEHGLSSQDRARVSGSEDLFPITLCTVSWITRLYEFYTAPVVKFWFHTMSYLAFLMLFSYTILVKMDDQPGVQEWLVILYILTTAVEKTREVLMSEPRKLSHKLKIWFSEYWNVSDFIAIVIFLFALVMRWHADPYRTVGRIAYCLDFIFWFVRVMDLLAVNQHAGPYLTMITKMTSNMFFIVVMMAIVLLSFGVSRKAILSPDEDPSWSLARDVVFQPYWMIYGEVYASEIDPCDDGHPCAPASFLTAFLQAVYMFFQYIIMVNILIAFFNNIYFDMASTSNKLWKYNRYRYIMTYLDRPWLPPPLILLSHMSFALRAIYKRLNGNAEGDERSSGLKLYLARDDRKKLHEFEEKCVQAYLYEKTQDLYSSQMNRIGVTADRAEEMCTMVGEVSEKVNIIQDSLTKLDSQLGELQDLSALAVDTLTLLSASDNLHQEEARLAQSRLIQTSQHALPHSWTLHRSGADYDVANMRRLTCKPFRSTPPSLIKGYILRHGPQESHLGIRGSRGEREGQMEEGENELPDAHHASELCVGVSRDASPSTVLHLHGVGSHLSGFSDQTPFESRGPSRCGSPLFFKFADRGLDTPHKPWSCDAHLYPNCEEIDMEEEEEQGSGDEKKEQKEPIHEHLSNLEESKSTSNVLLSDPGNISQDLENGTLRQDVSQLNSQNRTFVKSPRSAYLSRDHPYGYCRSLSTSVEDMTFFGALPISRGASFPYLNEAPNKQDGKRSFRDDTSLKWSRTRELSKSSDFTQTMTRRRTPNRKTVKIQASSPDNGTVDTFLSDACWNRWRRLKGEPACWSASTSLSQLNFEPLDLQKQVFSHQDVLSPTHSAWNSWSRSVSRRSSLQSGFAAEGSSSFQSTDMLYPHYSAMERNNLMRLAQTIPFTPVSILGGEEVSIYSLEEVHSEADPESSTVSSWSSRGLSAMLQPLPSEEGSLDGGLRRGRRVLCTWAERDVLIPGMVYVVKAFRPEVLSAWQKYFHGSTALQLCLREIQQQRAAHRMMQVFNKIKPAGIKHSPKFLDVSLVLWHSNGQWLTIERNMSGNFQKYNNNTGEEITPSTSLEELLLAFSHWTYEYSCTELLVLDVQGVGEELTDPTVIMAEMHSGRREMLFGPDNLGDSAINAFLQKHSCGACCHTLGLSALRRHLDTCKKSSEAEPAPGETEQEDERGKKRLG
ncbi:transient receptor potential cation channel subfamily M member 6 isoform X2 [Hippocampus comes]|uniref:transient receptor potential cation channel subfamily M member 6 isoform X2 n=1 Tax=Hippocampus comes TaxID=109280 RepID=UPI00094EA127|nr:PREDICTED: transient receptor potential cation channel subfamily M member 7-like isoform X2 [Hippocampus comes]